jgi:hypothetical protein
MTFIRQLPPVTKIFAFSVFAITTLDIMRELIDSQKHRRW